MQSFPGKCLDKSSHGKSSSSGNIELDADEADLLLVLESYQQVAESSLSKEVNIRFFMVAVN